MKTYIFDHYFEYAELTSMLTDLSQRYPGLIKVSSICTTPDNHEVWAAEITNYATGDVLSKPAYYVDGNHHAGEVTGSMAGYPPYLHPCYKIRPGRKNKGFAGCKFGLCYSSYQPGRRRIVSYNIGKNAQCKQTLPM